MKVIYLRTEDEELHELLVELADVEQLSLNELVEGLCQDAVKHQRTALRGRIAARERGGIEVKRRRRTRKKGGARARAR